MIEQKPKIIGIYKELNLIAKEVHIKLGRENADDDSEVYVVDPDPNVTETITCTDCVCSHGEFNIKDRLESFQVKFVLPKTLRLAENVNINLKRRSSK
jgi:hypothetical protein